MSIKKDVTNTAIYASLYGLRTVLEREFEIPNIFIQMSEEQKAFLLRKGATSYPHMIIKLTSMRMDKDQVNLKSLALLGRTFLNKTSITLVKNYMMPVTLEMALLYRNNSVQEALLFLEHFLILSVTDKLNFLVKVGDSYDWLCRLVVTDASVSIEEAQLTNENDPNAFEFNIPFELHTYCGVMKDVPMSVRPIFTLVTETIDSTLG